METKELREHIENIIKDTFKRVQYAFDNNKENDPFKSGKMDNLVSRLVFPSYSGNGTRISEQELRFCFTEAFNDYFRGKNLPIYYSVETPTRENYSGFSKSRKGLSPDPKRDQNGRSGEFDLVIYELDNNKMKRRCLIEFKANNASPLDHNKDFVKLNEPDEWKKNGEQDVELRYFIEMIDGYRADTLKSLREKTQNKSDTRFICYSLRECKDISEEINKG